MQKEIKILHISDFQFGRNHRFGRLGEGETQPLSLDTLYERLAADLTQFSNGGPLVDLLVVTGDVAETGSRKEFQDALEFLRLLQKFLGLAANRIIIIPGNHDVNRDHCQSYFFRCSGDGDKPKVPYFCKWENYLSFLKEFHGSHSSIFTEALPWSIHSIPELKLVICGMNSTMTESHRPEDHYGYLGEQQLNWYREALEKYKKDEWFRIGLVHHNIERGQTDDDENLRDADDLRRYLGEELNLILHGHTHRGRLGYINPNLPVCSTGSAALKTAQTPAETGNQYQLITIRSNGFERALRRYEVGDRRWVGDTSQCAKGDVWKIWQKIEFINISSCFGLAEESAHVPGPGVPQSYVSVVKLNNSVTKEEAEAKLRNVVRLNFVLEPQHRAIRNDLVEKAVSVIAAKRPLWLVADWLLGKEGFLASVLNRFGGDEFLKNVFRIDCSNAGTVEEVISAAEIQFGLSFNEFAAALAVVPNAVLLLDDLPQPLLSIKEQDAIRKRLRLISDFCEAIPIVLSTRIVPKRYPHDDVVVLGCFDIIVVRVYLILHRERP
jgi:3',5'-cyclic AMP phosphodiesterase CpdA